MLNSFQGCACPYTGGPLPHHLHTSPYRGAEHLVSYIQAFMITVIVPVYNAATTLRRCVDSILHQSYRDFELLLIDDGSTDSSPLLCDAYAHQDSRVRVFHKSNGGVSSARNVGLDHARGEWITFCDADDWVFPSWLENYMGHGDDYDLIVQGFELSYANSSRTEKTSRGVSYSGDIKTGLLELHREIAFGYLWVKLFRTSIIHSYKLHFDCAIRLYEDDDFLLSYATHCGRMLSTLDCGYHYYLSEFAKKYRNELQANNAFYLMEHLLERSWALYGEDSERVLCYVNGYTDALMDMYRERQKGRRNNLRRYRRVAGRLLLKSRLFSMTRWLIYLDASCFISSLFINIHVNIKRRIR